jgi:hypothetical protein
LFQTLLARVEQRLELFNLPDARADVLSRTLGVPVGACQPLPGLPRLADWQAGQFDLSVGLADRNHFFIEQLPVFAERPSCPVSFGGTIANLLRHVRDT